MAADEGYGNFSGGGSVHWEVQASDSSPLTVSPDLKRTKALTVSGIEGAARDDGGKFFTIAIQDAERVEWVVENNVLTLTVPIRTASKPPTRGAKSRIAASVPQINVRWAIEKSKCPKGRVKLPVSRTGGTSK